MIKIQHDKPHNDTMTFLMCLHGTLGIYLIMIKMNKSPVANQKLTHKFDLAYGQMIIFSRSQYPGVL